MESDLISVIIPVYNREKYLSRCIESVLKQTYRNLELILVDDGSRDRSAAICDKYAKKDSRVLVIHKINEGVSVARNVGMASAHGRYVCFVDSDDWLTPNSLGLLYESMVAENADLVSGEHYRVYECKTMKAEETIYVPFEIAETDVRIFEGPVAKLYRQDLISQFKICFPKDMKCREDTVFLYHYLTYCKKVVSVATPVYYCNRIMHVSATRSFFPQYGEWQKRVSEERIRLFQLARPGQEYSQELLRQIVDRYMDCCRYYIDRMREFDALDVQLEELHEMFAPLLHQVPQGFIQTLPDSDRQAVEGVSFELLKQQVVLLKASKWRVKVKRVLGAVREFVIFRLKFGWKY